MAVVPVILIALYLRDDEVNPARKYLTLPLLYKIKVSTLKLKKKKYKMSITFKKHVVVY